MPTNQCPACKAGIPPENGRRRYGLPGGYRNYQPCLARVTDPNRQIADYLVRLP